MGPGPIRTCVGCRRRRPQGDLVRVVRRPDGSVTGPAPSGAPGRGAYVCFDPACVREAISSGRLRRGLRHEGPLPPGLEEELLRSVDERT
jgi:predicted RNA-binding protein YlxR (DUF448 family)